MLNNNFSNLEKRNDFHLFSNQNKVQKRLYTNSIDKILKENQWNKLISDEQINENIKQCYNNLKNLRNAFKGKKQSPKPSLNISKVLDNNKLENSKSIGYSKEFSKDSNRINKENNLTRNININNLKSIQKIKNSNSLKNNLKDSLQLSLTQDYKYNNSLKENSDKNSLMKSNLSHKNNNNVNVTIGDTIYNNQLLFSNRQKKDENENNSIKDNYIYFLQKQLDESGKKNKELIQMYKEIEKKCENLVRDNKILNTDLNESRNKNREKIDELTYKERFKTEYSNNDDSLIILKNTNEELRKNLMLMTSKFSDNFKNSFNFSDSEIIILKEKNELLSKNLQEKEQKLKNCENEIEKLTLENKELKNQIDDYRNKLESTLLTLQEKEKLIIKLQSNKEKYQNESRESFSEIISEDKSLKIYKKKSSIDFKFKIENKIKTKRPIEEIKLKIPFTKSNNQIQEIQIKKNYEQNQNKEYSKNTIKKENENNIKEYTYSNPEIDNILTTSLFGNNINYDSYNFIINPNDKKLFSINSDSNFTEYNIQNKKFSKHNLGEMKIYDSYDKEFQSEGTIILNTLNGLFILTGKNSNQLFYFNDQKKTIRKICTFINNHNCGSLYLDDVNRRIFSLSGKYNKKVEYYSFENTKIKEIPELSIERANATYCIINNKLYSFFGYCFPMNNYTETIECIDLKLMDRWNYISVSTELDELNIQCISSVHIEGRSYVYLFGGIKGDGDLIYDFFYKFDTYGNEVEKIEFDDDEKIRCLFTKNSNFIKIDNHYFLMDDNYNIHIVDASGHFSVFNYK